MPKKQTPMPVGEFQEELHDRRNGQEQPASTPEDFTPDMAATMRVTPTEDAQDLATWDLDQLRVSPDLTVEISGEPVLTTLEVRKPRKQEWFRVRPGETWRFFTSLLILEEDKSVYLVAPPIQPLLEHDVAPACLYTVVTRTGTLFLWPVRLVLQL